MFVPIARVLLLPNLESENLIVLFVIIVEIVVKQKDNVKY